MTETLNCKITSTKIFITEYNRIEINLVVESGATGCILPFSYDKLRDILETLEISEYEKIKGSYVRVSFVSNVSKKLGNIIKDIWIDV